MHRAPLRLIAVPLLAALALTLAACSSSSSSSTTTSAPAGHASGATSTTSGAGNSTSTTGAAPTTAAPAAGATTGADASECAQAKAQAQSAAPAPGEPTVTVPSGPPPSSLTSKDLTTGTGPKAQPGDTVTVKYVGVSYTCHFIFDASWTDGAANGEFSFQLGAGKVIPGWDQGLVGMQAGGRRLLIIPPADGYGVGGQPPLIIPDDTLIFVVDMVSITPG